LQNVESGKIITQYSLPRSLISHKKLSTEKDNETVQDFANIQFATHDEANKKPKVSYRVGHSPFTLNISPRDAKSARISHSIN
jgi:hypothetical protein